MGGQESKSKTLTDIITRNAVSVMVNHSQSSSASATSDQVFYVSGNRINIKGFSMKQGVKINLDQYQDIRNVQDLQNKVEQSLMQGVKAQNSMALGILNKSEAEARTQIRNDISTNINQSTMQSMAMRLKNVQHAIILGTGHNIENVSLEQTAEAYIKLSQEAISKMSLMQELNNKVTQKAEAKQKGIVDTISGMIGSVLKTLGLGMLSPLLIMILLPVIIIIIIVAAISFGGKKQKPQKQSTPESN